MIKTVADQDKPYAVDDGLAHGHHIGTVTHLAPKRWYAHCILDDKSFYGISRRDATLHLRIHAAGLRMTCS